MKRWSKYILSISTLLFIGLMTSLIPDGKEKSMDVDSISSKDQVRESTFFLDIHQHIISTNCALPACHDGSFEPNFTTPQAMYYSTVLHPVLKNALDGSYTYRIVPKDTAASLLLERISNCCFINENDRMPVLMEPLPQRQIDSIAQWVLLGAPDWRNEFPYEK